MVEMEAEEDGVPGFQALVLGETDAIPEQESNTVRIFMSSTFTDMKEERNKLIQEVFPALRSYCQQRKLEFEVVDMRWGVRDSATADHSTSILCLNEIDRCKRMSQGPYFVAILGNKYGYRPLKASIPSDVFEKLIEVISGHDTVNQDDVDLVKKWYRQDANAVPPAYVLQPITVHLPDYYNANDKEMQVTARNNWWIMFERMKSVFDEAARLATEAGVYSEEEMHVFVMSVTEEEIRHSLGGNANIQDTCLVFIRDFQDLRPTYEQRHTMSHFTDVDTNEEKHTTEFMKHPQALLTKLKTEYIPSVVPQESRHTYTLPWREIGLDPADCPEHARYLEEMCALFETRIKTMIDKRLGGRRSAAVDHVKSDLYKELLHHASFCKTKCSVFQGREELLTSIKAFLTSTHRKPLVVHGVSGSGKTSVMAMVARLAKEWLGEGCVTVLRFLGTSALSTSIHATLQSMCRQLCFAYGAKQPSNDQLEDFSALVQVFNLLIRKLPTSDNPLLLVFDSIDQLNASNNAHKMNWLTKNLSENTHIVVSMLPKEHNCLDNIRMTLTDPACFIAMQGVPQETCVAIMDGWLKRRGRKLTQEQVDHVSAAFSKCPQPLFLKLLFEEFVDWPSYKELGKLPSTVAEAIKIKFQELEDNHGYIFVAHTLGYLTAGKSGLTEGEMEDILSCDDEVLNDVYQYWDPPVKGVVRIPSSVWKRLRYDIAEFTVERQSGGKTVLAWYHRQFIETAHRRYLGNDKTKEARHKLLADMFLGEYSNGAIKPIRLDRRNKDIPDADRLVAPQPLMFGDEIFNLRKLIELPFHLLQSMQKDGIPEGMVKHVMYNFEWILTKLRAFDFLELISDFTEFDKESGLLIDALYLSGTNVKEDPFSLAGQLIGCMADLTDGNPNIARLLEGARSWIQSTDMSLIIPRGACLVPPGGQLKTSLHGHPNRVEAIACTSSASILVTVCKDIEGQPMANVWEESTAELIHTLQVKLGSKVKGKLSLAISHDDKHVVFGCQVLGMFEIASGACLRKLETGSTCALSSLQLSEDGTLAIAGAESGCKAYVWELHSGNLTKLDHEGTVHFVFFEGNSELLSVCKDGLLRHWSIASQECLHSVAIHRRGEVKAATHSKSTKMIISGGGDGVIKLTSYLNKPTAPEKTLEGHRKAVSCLLVLSDILLASGSADFTVRVWNMVEGTPVLKCLGHSGYVTSLWHDPVDPGVANSRSILVSGSKDDYVKVWNLDPKDPLKPLITTLEGHTSWVTDVTGSSKKHTIYSASNDKSARVWDYTRQTVIKRERHAEHAFAVIFTPDKSTVITSGEDNSVKFSRFRDGQVTRHETGFAVALQVSRDGRRLIGALRDEGVVRVWNMDQSEGEGVVFELPGCPQGITCMDLGNGQDVVVGLKDMNVKVLDLENRTCRLTLKGHTACVEKVKVVQQQADTLIMSGDTKGMLKIWNYSTGECLLSAHENKASMRCLGVSPDGQFAASGYNDKKLILWSLKAESFGSEVKRLLVHSSEVTCMAFTSDGKRIISGSHASESQLHVWNFLEDDDTEDHFLVGHHHAIMDLKLSADDQYLVTASRDCTMKAWHLPSGTLMASFDNKSQIKTFDMVRVGDDHYRLAAENKTGTILLLDLLLPKADRADICVISPSNNDDPTLATSPNTNQSNASIFETATETIIKDDPSKGNSSHGNESHDQADVSSPSIRSPAGKKKSSMCVMC